MSESTEKKLLLTGEKIFSDPKEETALDITESYSDHVKWPETRINPLNNESNYFIDRSNITLKSSFLDSPQDLTQVYLLADAKVLYAFIMYVRTKLEEKDLMIRELQFEIEKLNKKKKFSSAGFRLPKDYYKNEAYFVA